MKDHFNILIADDDLDDQELMKEGLRDCKVSVSIKTLHDGVQVMDYLRGYGRYRDREMPDLVLLDLNMPLMDGFAVLEEIRRYPELLSIPIYVITTSRNVDHHNQALNLGAKGVYSKGAKSVDIARIMHEICAECFEES